MEQHDNNDKPPDTMDNSDKTPDITDGGQHAKDIKPGPFKDKFVELCRTYCPGIDPYKNIGPFASNIGISKRQAERIRDGVSAKPRAETLWGLASYCFKSNDIKLITKGTTLEKDNAYIEKAMAWVRFHKVNVMQPPDPNTGIPSAMSTLTEALPKKYLVNWYTGEEGFKILSGAIKGASAVLNTGITETTFSIETTAGMLQWQKEAIDAIRHGVVFIDVISKYFLDIAKERLEISAKIKGAYEYKCIEVDMPPVLNFTVIKYKRRPSIVFFGWLISGRHRLDKACISTTEPHIVQLFEDWHNDLFGSNVTPTT